MKLAVVFEVPDEQADAYLDISAWLVDAHRSRQFGPGDTPIAWSFDLAMRPVAAVVGATDTELTERLTEALSAAS